MQFHGKFLFDSLRSDINYKIKCYCRLCFEEIYSINVVEKNPVPKSQTKSFYIGTKEAPSGSAPLFSPMQIVGFPMWRLNFISFL